MSRKARTTFRIAGWDEETVLEQERGRKVNRARVTKTYEGELSGEGIVEYLMGYKADGSATFSGFELVTGSVGGKAGTFMFVHRGTFKNGEVDSVWSVVEGSGTGALTGLTGTVAFSAKHQDEYSFAFDYDLLSAPERTRDDRQKTRRTMPPPG